MGGLGKYGMVYKKYTHRQSFFFIIPIFPYKSGHGQKYKKEYKINTELNLFQILKVKYPHNLLV